MIIYLNGVEKELSAGVNVGQLVGQLNLTPPRVAVELNRDILPRAEYEKTILQPGDQVEIVTFVGGG